MGRLGSGRWEEVLNPRINKKLDGQNEKIGNAAMFRETVKNFAKDHPLRQEARTLLERYKKPENISRGDLKEISRKTGYEPGLIGAMAEDEAEKIMENKTTLH